MRGEGTRLLAVTGGGFQLNVDVSLEFEHPLPDYACVANFLDFVRPGLEDRT